MKKGFTLIELLAVIGLLSAILILAVPQILDVVENARIKAYQDNELMMNKAAETYLAANRDLIPTVIGGITKIELDSLKSKDYITNITDSSGVECDGYVVISKVSEGELSYNPYIECGLNYETYGGYIDDSLLVHLDGYDEQNTNFWIDSSGNDYDAELVNFSDNYGYQPNKKGYVLDGIDDYIDLGQDPIFSLTNNLTLEYVVSIGEDYNNVQGITLANRRGQSYSDFYWFMIYYGDGYFQYRNDTHYVGLQTSSKIPYKADKPFYISVTVDINAEKVKFYVNGVLFEEKDAPGITYATGSYNLYIGSYQTWNTEWQWNGVIKDVRIYNKVLTDVEIAHNYYIDKQRYGL